MTLLYGSRVLLSTKHYTITFLSLELKSTNLLPIHSRLVFHSSFPFISFSISVFFFFLSFYSYICFSVFLSLSISLSFSLSFYFCPTFSLYFSHSICLPLSLFLSLTLFLSSFHPSSTFPLLPLPVSLNASYLVTFLRSSSLPSFVGHPTLSCLPPLHRF